MSGAGPDHFNFNATILGAAFGCLVVGDRLFLAFAFRVDSVGFDALGDQVCLDCISAANRQFLVVSNGTDRVSVTNSDDDFQVDCAQFRCQVVQLSFAFWLQDSFVEVK